METGYCTWSPFTWANFTWVVAPHIEQPELLAAVLWHHGRYRCHLHFAQLDLTFRVDNEGTTGCQDLFFESSRQSLRVITPVEDNQPVRVLVLTDGVRSVVPCFVSEMGCQ